MDIHDTPAAVDERKRQAAAERARRYRAAKRDEGKPDSNAVDAALGEAASFLASIAIPEVRGAGEEAKVALVIDIEQLHKTAVINLVRHGAKRSYARQAVSARINKRSIHDAPHMMPSRRLTDAAAAIERPVNNVWLESEIAFVRKIVARWRDAVARAKC